MEFIEPEEFLKEDKEVQEVINNSIKLNIGDRIYHKLSKKYYIYLGEYNEAFWNVFDLEDKCTSVICRDYFCRCFTEGELRKFVEDKIKCRIESVPNDEGYLLCFWDDDAVDNRGMIQINTLDLLQAYWQVAVQITKKLLIINKK